MSLETKKFEKDSDYSKVKKEPSFSNLVDFNQLNQILSGNKLTTSPIISQVVVLYSKKIETLAGKPYEILLVENESQTRAISNFTDKHLVEGCKYQISYNIAQDAKGYNLRLFLDQSILLEQNVFTKDGYKIPEVVGVGPTIKEIVVSDVFTVKWAKDEELFRTLCMTLQGNQSEEGDEKSSERNYYLNIWRNTIESTEKILIDRSLIDLEGQIVKLDRYGLTLKPQTSYASLKALRQVSNLRLL